MKKLPLLILTGLLLLTGRPAVSQTGQAILHAVLVGDTADPETGTGHLNNLQKMQKQIAQMAKSAGMEADIVRIDSVGFSAVNVTDRISEIRIDSADAFIFYFSGSEYLRFVRGNTGRNMRFGADTYLSVGAVAALLESKNTRFFLILTDLCNQAGENSPELPSEQFVPDSQYVRMFLEKKGKVILDNHEKKDQSHGGIGEKGSIFTAGIVQALREGGDWQTVADRSRALTIYASRGGQNPRIMTQTFDADAPQKTVPEPIKPLKLRIVSDNPAAEIEAENEPVADAPSLEFMRKNSTEHLTFWQNALTVLSDGPAASLSEKSRRREEIKARLLQFFAADSSVLIEMQAGQNRSFFLSPKMYLDRIGEEVTATYRQNRGWYRPAEIGEFIETPEGFFRANAILYAETRLTQAADNELISVRRCEHSVRLSVRPDKQNIWRVFAESIRIRPGSCRYLKISD